MAVQNFRDLVAWQKAMELVVEVYRVSASFPADERFGLTAQLRRAAVSVPSNIAEGQGRGPNRDFVRFLAMARGSVQELDTQLTIAARLDYLPPDRYESLQATIAEVARIINGLIRSIPVE